MALMLSFSDLVSELCDVQLNKQESSSISAFVIHFNEAGNIVMYLKGLKALEWTFSILAGIGIGFAILSNVHDLSLLFSLPFGLTVRDVVVVVPALLVGTILACILCSAIHLRKSKQSFDLARKARATLKEFDKLRVNSDRLFPVIRNMEIVTIELNNWIERYRDPLLFEDGKPRVLFLIFHLTGFVAGAVALLGFQIV